MLFWNSAVHETIMIPQFVPSSENSMTLFLAAVIVLTGEMIDL
jgi:hypothetical protein